jgi:hypothetical protein
MKQSRTNFKKQPQHKNNNINIINIIKAGRQAGERERKREKRLRSREREREERSFCLCLLTVETLLARTVYSIVYNTVQ